MIKLIKIILLLISSSVQAVGGDFEEISSEECQQKGLVQIYSPKKKFTGSAVFFKEGRGLLGLTARHVAENLMKYKTYIDFGNVSYKVIQFFCKEDDDLAVFTIEHPIHQIDNFFELPKYSDLPSVMEADFYGFGESYDKEYLGALKNSDGICRRSTIFISAANIIVPTKIFNPKGSIENLKKPIDDIISAIYKDSIHNNPFIFFAVPHNYKCIEDDTIDFKIKELSLKNTEKLPASSSFYMCGDSGGPIVKNNKIVGINSFVTFLSSTYSLPYIDFALILEENTIENAFNINLYFGSEKIKLQYTVIIENEKIITYIYTPHKYLFIFYNNYYIINLIKKLKNSIENKILNDLRSFISGKSSVYFSTISKKYSKKEIEFLKNYNLIFFNHAVSVQDNLEWVHETIINYFNNQNEKTFF